MMIEVICPRVVKSLTLTWYVTTHVFYPKDPLLIDYQWSKVHKCDE